MPKLPYPADVDVAHKVGCSNKVESDRISGLDYQRRVVDTHGGGGTLGNRPDPGLVP